jgi:hypothetical protein
MNMQKKPSIDELKDIFSQCDDEAAHHVLWIDKSGEVFLSRLPEELTPIGFEEAKPEMQVRFETYSQGTGYVGSEAANDNKFIANVFNSLLKVWPKAKNQNRVEYVDY